jgi:multidrug transporter EmrE-like cation transporter
MQWVWLSVAIVATVAYHLVLKLTPAAANPFLSLAVTYAVVTLAFASLYLLMPGGMTLHASLQVVNWTAFVLGAVIVFLDLGFLLLYRSGFEVSLGQLVTQSAAALLLLALGVAYFREALSLGKVAGILLCVVGLWLVSRR